jgi:hypothetical protein
MKRLKFLSIGVLVLGLIFLGSGKALALNDFCDDLISEPGVCRVTTSHSLGTGALTFTVDRVLRITTGGELKVTPPPATTLTLNIAGGSPTGLIIENGGKITGDTASGTDPAATININVANGDILLAASGAFITADNTKGGGCGSGKGGTINLTANGSEAKIITEDGSVISASGLSASRTLANPNPALGTCSAGAINISAENKGDIDIDGDVLAESGRPGDGPTQQPGGGPIFIQAACDLTITDTGKVSSLGQDPGADLVHLKGGCDVLIIGLVQSTGVGHVTPKNPPNSCNNFTPINGSPPRRNPATRPDKPSNSTACVEVWAGDSLTIIRDTSGNNGEINADTGHSPGGSSGTSWIDLFARGEIQILSTFDSAHPTANAAVHANGNAGTNDNGGVITVKSAGTGPTASPGKIVLNGLALQANATGSGGQGGTVDIEAVLDVDLRAIDISHVDGIVQAMGATGGGGTQHGGHIIIFSQNNILAGAASNLNVTGRTPSDGTVVLTACLTIDFPPGTVTGAGTFNKSPGVCPPPPTFEPYVRFQDCPCNGGPLPGTCEKSTVKAVLNPVTGRFPGNLGPDVTVRLDLGQKVQDAVNTATDSNGDGYIIILVVKDNTGTLGGNTTQKVAISKAYPQPFALIGCSVTLHDPNKGDNLPTGLIESSANSPLLAGASIFVMDLHGADSEIAGWLVEGDNRYMRNVANSNNSIAGIAFLGNNNTMHNGNGNNNVLDGIVVAGNRNLVDSSDAFGNGETGILVAGDGNTIKKTDVGDKGKGNTGDGIFVSGNSNKLQENDCYASGGNGIELLGNGNTLLKNNVGDKGKGNTGDGILLVGTGNLLQENEAYANGGYGFNVTGGANTLNKNKSGDRGDKANTLDGFLLGGGGSLVQNTAIGNLGDGFELLTSGFSLSKNVSGGTGSGYPNGGCQYLFDVAGNVNAGGNKSNNVTLVGTPFPAGCK